MQKTQSICLAILATIAIAFSLYYLKTVLLPFVIAVFIVIGCRPILEFIENKLKLPRFLAFVFSFLIGIWLLVMFAFLIWVSVNDLANNSSVYKKRMNVIITWIVELVPNSDQNDDVSGDPDDAASDPDDAAGDPNDAAGDPNDAAADSDDMAGESDGAVDDSDDVADASAESDTTPNESKEQSLSAAKDPTRAVQEFLTSISTYVQSQMVSLAGSLSSLLSYGVLILIFVFFLLLGNGEMSHSRSENQDGILGKIEDQIRKYLLMKTVISLVTGFAFGLVLWLFDVPLAVVFGFLAFLLNFIPNIGPLISSILPVPFLVLNSAMSPTSAIICFILISTIQFVSGNVIETRMMGKSFDVSPVTLLLALMFFGLVWGIVGMFLATPIVSIIKIILQQRASTRPIADLMAGRLGVLDTYQG